jgi:hypothetical protein
LSMVQFLDIYSRENDGPDVHVQASKVLPQLFWVRPSLIFEMTLNL